MAIFDSEANVLTSTEFDGVLEMVKAVEELPPASKEAVELIVLDGSVLVALDEAAVIGMLDISVI